MRSIGTRLIDSLFNAVQHALPRALGGAVSIDSVLLEELQTGRAALLAEREAARAAGPPGAQLQVLVEWAMPAAAPLAAALLRAELCPSPAYQAGHEVAVAFSVAAGRGCCKLRCPDYTNAGRLKKCCGCNVARYCGPACHKAAWRAGHKRVCAQLGPGGGNGSSGEAGGGT